MNDNADADTTADGLQLAPDRTTLTDGELQARATRAFKSSDHSYRSLAGQLDCSVSSLHEALNNTPASRLRKLRMRVLTHLEGGSCSVHTVIQYLDEV